MSQRSRIRIEQSQRLSLNTRLVASIRLIASDSPGLSRFLEDAAAANPQLVVEPPPQGDWLPRWTTAFARLGGTAGPQIEQLADTAAPGLLAHVEAQIVALRLPAADLRLAHALADALEPSGWLGRPLPQVAAEAGASPEAAGAMLRRLQGLEPAGLFARNLAECLRLQAADQGWLDPLAEAVLDRLPLVAQGDIARLARQVRAPEAAVRQVIRRIRGLDPKPGARFGPCVAPIREPDLMARRGRDGWEVALNASSLPSLRLADNKGPGRAEARALIRMVEGRNATLLRVAREILIRQAPALDEGLGALQPMTMAEVAAALSLNQSTVSRVVAGAAIDTPRGTWWLRALFSQAIRGQGPAAASLREALARMVAQEDPAAPLSDADLAAQLAGAGAPVARRTVAKYREMLGIPPAHQRRRRDSSGRLRG